MRGGRHSCGSDYISFSISLSISLEHGFGALVLRFVSWFYCRMGAIVKLQKVGGGYVCMYVCIYVCMYVCMYLFNDGIVVS